MAQDPILLQNPILDLGLSQLPRDRFAMQELQNTTASLAPRDIWASGYRNGITSGRDTSHGRDKPPVTSVRGTEGRIGSGALVGSSISDSPWPNTRNTSLSQNFPQSMFFEQPSTNVSPSDTTTTFTTRVTDQRTLPHMASISSTAIARNNSMLPNLPTSQNGSSEHWSGSTNGARYFDSYTDLKKPMDIWSPPPSYQKVSHPRHDSIHKDSLIQRRPTLSRDASLLPVNRPIPETHHREDSLAGLERSTLYIPRHSSTSSTSGNLQGGQTTKDFLPDRHSQGLESLPPRFNGLGLRNESSDHVAYKSSSSNKDNQDIPNSHASTWSTDLAVSGNMAPTSSRYSESSTSKFPANPWSITPRTSPPDTRLKTTARDHVAAVRPNLRPDTLPDARMGQYARASMSLEDISGLPAGGGGTTVQSSPHSTRGSQNQYSAFEPRLQPMLANQLRQPWTPYYNPYAFFANPGQQATMSPSTASPNAFVPYSQNYLSYPPVSASSYYNSGSSTQSPLLCQFRATLKTKKWELRDIENHMVEFSGDQHGSRFIQTKLETADAHDRELLFRELQPNLIPLMSDIFGNYVIQKFFEHGDQTQKKMLANAMRDKVKQLSLQQYGCRVVQKALDHVLSDQQAMIVQEIEGDVAELVENMHGNHVIQKAIQQCQPAMIEAIAAVVKDQAYKFSTHGFGCRVVQRCLEKPELEVKPSILSQLQDDIPSMITDQYGNYVVQHIVLHNEGECKRRILAHVAENVERLSRHKYASNVVEKCIRKSDHVYRRDMVEALESSNRMSTENSVLATMIKDNYANYVIQTFLDTLRDDDYQTLIESLRPAVAQAKRTSPNNKQVLAVENKIERFQPLRLTNPRNLSPSNHAAHRAGSLQPLGMYATAGKLPSPTSQGNLRHTSRHDSVASSIGVNVAQGLQATLDEVARV